jgi:hypothetical protein
MCDFVQCTLPYIPSLKRERTNSYVCNSIRKGEMDIAQTEWKRTGEKYSQLTSHAWLSENRDVCFKIDQ